MSDEIPLYPDLSPRHGVARCTHCTAKNHETLRLCMACGHEVRVPREACLCTACVHEPLRPEWRQATIRDFPKLAD